MMAFFILMWLLNATTEKQRKGLADYFHPTIAVSCISGGGDGMLSGDSLVLENGLKHINTKEPDRGLIIEIFDTVDNSLFDSQGQFTPLLNTLIKMMSDVFELVTKPISIEGHIRSYPIVLKDKPVWRNSVERALIVQNLFTNYDFERTRIHRVAGHADWDLATESPMEIHNNRLEITLLRTGYTQ